MKKIFLYKIQGLALIALLVGAVFLSGCDDDESTPKEIVLLSFGPSGVHHGDEIIFIGQNLDKVNSIVFKPSVEVTDFVEKNSNKIRVIVPDAAEAGKVILRTASGDIESKTILNFEVPVEILSITAEAKPGTNITITGNKINWIESVTFTSDVVVEKENFVSQSLTELVVTVPMEAQSGFLIFSTGGTEPLTFGSEEQLTVTLPAITSVSPQAIRHEGELTISGTNLDLVTSIVFADDIEVTKTNFVNHSEDEIKVLIPRQTVKGKITLKQVSPISVVSENEVTITLPIGTSISPSPAVPGTDVMTITGTDLDLIKELILPGYGSLTTFTSQTSTEIVFPLPAEATQGPLNYITVHDFAAPLGLVVFLPGEGPPALIVPVFEDATASSVGEGGGWGSTSEFGNAEQAFEGSKSIKVTYTGGGAGAQFGTWGRPDLSLAGTEVYTFALYGGAGTDGKTVRAGLKSDGDWVWKNVTIAEGEWTSFEIPISEWNFTFVREIAFDNNNGELLGTIYIDRVGFSVASGPKELITVLYDETTTDLVGQGGGWGSTTDFANIEQAREGSKSVKVTYTGGGAGAQLGTWGRPDITLAGTTVFAFSAFGGDGTDGETLRVGLKSDGDWVWKDITLVGGKWKDYEIPLSEWNFTFVREIAFDNNNGAWLSNIYLDYIGFR